jgi:uracil-DNA glycosylase
MLAADDSQALQALLDFYRACGVDLALDAAPHDRFAESVRPAPPPPAPEARPPAPSPRESRSPAPLFPREATRAAEDAAAAAQTLDELRENLAAFEGLGAAAKARHFLFSSGAPAPLMALDYAPGDAEESGGAPFCGPEARLLGAMLAAIGQSRESAYLAYFSPWRPPGGQPFAAHIAATLAPFARRHIALARPKAVLLMGEFAKSLIPANEPLARLYGQSFDLDGAIAVPAPGLGAMLKTATMKPAAWRALRAVTKILAQ